ncbi:MAG TPA: Gfo/Idh/MocA family oxidoreductase [Bryobacteraceae bacterium]|jgi:1,5-anhydro-D-fructose reductase (1,5-anhydro-D-mannitol-forming)|nr:Gfo/Idh/MocA family oxidoreductase [Bryobacteraceae bacterium]
MLNWLVIGIGDITTKRVIPAIRSEKRSRLYGVVTRDKSKGAGVAEHVWDDLDMALADPQVDAVYVATPVALHGPQTIAALKAGKHVLCEKPVAMNYSEASEMVRVSKETGKVLGVAYYRRTYPKVQRARELISQGAIGQPVLAEANHHSASPAQGSFRSWLLDPKLAGGGPLFDVASHRIDLLNYLFGEPARAVGLLSNAVFQWPIEDNATVLIEYENGVRGIVDVRWHSDIVRDQFRIIGTKGEINLDPLSGPELVHPDGREDLPAHANIHFPMIENFVAAVLDGAPLLSSGESAIWTDWVTEQVYCPDAALFGSHSTSGTPST